MKRVHGDAPPHLMNMMRKLMEDYALSAVGKKVADLTDAQRTSIAFIAGCKMRYWTENGELRFKTVNHVGIVDDPNEPSGFRVYERVLS